MKSTIKLLALAAALAATGLAPTVRAMPDMEEVVVTGSRIKTSDGFGSVSPVTVVSNADITATGLTRLEDVLNSLPAIETAQNAFYSNGATGTAQTDLRGLTPARTLVLVNGRRLQPGGVNTLYTDINQIPAALVDRVEVLTGGASATYGADAVAGVVNFIMRRVDGVEISVQASGYQHNNDNNYIQGLMDAQGYAYPDGNGGFDGTTWNLDLIAGGDIGDGRGNATVYATYRENDELRQASRDFSSCSLNAAGTACGGSATADIPNFLIAPITTAGTGEKGYAFDLELPLTLQPDSSLAISDGTNVYNFAPNNHFMRPNTRYSLGGFVDYEISDHFTPYIEAGFTSDSTTAQVAESGTFFAETYILPLDNALFPAAFQASLATLFPGATEFGVHIGKRNVEGGPRAESIDHDSYRIIIGSRGDVTPRSQYDVYYQYGRTSSSSVYTNDFFAPLIATAVDAAACAEVSTCIPYEVFTYNGVSASAARSLTGVASATGETAEKVLGGFLSTDLRIRTPTASDTIKLIVGLEHRTERYERIADAAHAEGLLLGQGGNFPSLSGGYEAIEFYGEASIPLVQNMAFMEGVTLDLAYRYSDYNTTSVSHSWRMGLDWQILDFLRLRTGYNRAVRVPNVGELFSDNQRRVWQGVDPCEGTAPQLSEAECARTGVTADQYGNITPSPASQYNQLTGGNPNLEPETADTVTFGLVVDPIDNMTVSVDYWDIEIEDTIATIGAELIIEQCALAGELCDAIIRSGNGSLWQGNTGHIANTSQNLGGKHFEGVDIAGAYTIDALRGTFYLNFIGTFLLSKETTPLPANPGATYDCVGLVGNQCYASPEWRHTLSLRYDSMSFWSMSGKWRYFGGIRYDGFIDAIASNQLRGQSYLDLGATIQVMANSDIRIGLNNVLDREPPLVGGSLAENGNTIAGFYDTLGRFAFARATLRF